MSNQSLFDIATSDRYGFDSSSTAVLALRRFARRFAKQASACLLSLVAAWGIAAHGLGGEAIASSEAVGAYARAPFAQVAKRSAGGAHRLVVDGRQQAPRVGLSEAIAKGDKPFQTLRPKMTFHRLTTSRFSIPVEDYRTMAAQSERG